MAILIAAVVILLQWQYSTSNKKYYYPNDIINRSFDSKLSSVCPGDSVTFMTADVDWLQIVKSFGRQSVCPSATIQYAQLTFLKNEF